MMLVRNGVAVLTMIAVLATVSHAQAPNPSVASSFGIPSPYLTGTTTSPYFMGGPNVYVYENMQNLNPVPNPPAYTDGRNWATNINVSTLTQTNNWNNFVVANTNTRLFAVQPSVDNQGTLTFTLAKDQCGTANMTVLIRDSNSMAYGNMAWALIVVTCVNQCPVFTISYDNPITIPENYGLVNIPVWATGVNSGEALANDEVAQTLTFYPIADNNNFFSVLPVIKLTDSDTASLQFRVQTNTYGTTIVHVALHDDGGTLYGGCDTYIQTLTIVVTQINLPPSFVLAAPSLSVLENQYNTGYTRTLWALDVTPGLGEDAPSASTQVAQSVSFIVSADTQSFFTTQPAIDPSGTLTFATAKNAFGDVVVTVQAKDSFVPPAYSNRSTFVLHILPVNQPPTFTIAGDLTGSKVTQCNTAGTCLRTFTGYLTNPLPGPTNEGTQTLTVTVSCDPAFQTLFAVQPTIDLTSGTLSFTLAQYQHTTTNNPATMTVILKDNGGTSNGGVDTTVQTFLLAVTEQPAPPTFTPGSDLSTPIAVNENSGMYTYAAWATKIMATPTSSDTTALQFIVAAQNTALFATQPSILISAGNTGTLTFTPALNQFGSTIVTAYLSNPTTAQISDIFYFTIKINNVNQKPTFTTTGDLTLNQDSGAQVITWATSISAGPNEDTIQTVSFGITCTSYTLFTTGNYPTLDSTGVLKMTLAASTSGQTSCVVTATDTGIPPATTSQNFFITVRHINQPPTYTPGADLTMFETTYSGATTTILNWATNMNVGPSNPSTLTLTFVVTPQDPTWFSVAPRIDPTTGTLTFTLNPFQAGVTYLTHQLQNSGSNVAPDSNISPARKMQLVIVAVNQAPTFTIGPNIQVLQNSGYYRSAGWATLMSAGPTNEASQTLTFTCVPLDSTLFLLPPTVDPSSGDITFSTATNVAGSTSVSVCLMDNGGTQNGGIDNTCKTMTIGITAVNQVPTATSVAEVDILENSGAQSIPNFLTSVTTGPSTTDSKQYIKSVSCSVPLSGQLLFSKQPSIALNTWTLTFTPATNAVGTVVVTYSIQDSGGTLNGGVDTLTQTFIIKLIAVNGAPTFTAGPAITVKQNSGTYYALWATAIVVSPTITGLTAAFSVTVDQPSWFSVAPYVTSTGYLGFTLNPNVYGVVNLRVVLQNNGGTAYNGTDTSMPALTTLTITFVNTAPSFTMGPDLTVLENGSPFTYSAWATNIIAGPPMEDLAQHSGLKFILTPVTSSYFSVLPTIDAQTGDLTFTTATNKFGTTQVSVVLKDQGGVANGGSDTSAAKLITLQIVNVNQPPSATIQGDLVVLENAGDQVIKGWVTAVTAGPGEDSIQTTALSLTNDSPLLFSSPPRLVGKDLYFTPATNAFGTATLILNVTDNGGTANGGVDRSSVTARLTITAVNQQPYFTVGADITVQENSGTTSVAGWLTQASTGAANEVTQTLTASFSVDRTDILVSMPTLDFATGTLTFAVQQYASGTVTVSMTVKDNGGTANGGKDTSATQTFKIIVNFVNQPPSFVAGSPVIVASNAVSSYSIPWASNISAGPRETSQTVAFAVTNLKASLFTATGQPAIDASGVLTFTVAAGATGNTTLAVSLRDSAGGVSDVSYIVIQVISVNINTNVILTLNAVYESFNTATFKQIIANDLGISTSQIVIISIAKGSVIVTFQIVGSSGTTSDALTQTFVGHAQDPTSTVYKSLSVLAVSTVASGTSSGSGVNTNGSSGDNSSVNYVALGIGLAAAVLVISLLAIGGVVFYRRRQEKKRQQRFRQAAAAGFATSSHPYDDNNIPPTSKSNPIHGTFTSPLKQNANGTGASPQRQNSPGKGADEPYGDHYGDVYVGQQVDPFDGRPIRERELDRSPGRRKPNSAYVPVMTPPARIYAQPSPRMSRWPAARDQGNY